MKHLCPMFQYRAKILGTSDTVYGELIRASSIDPLIRGFKVADDGNDFGTFSISPNSLSCSMFLMAKDNVVMYTGDIIRMHDECDEETIGLLGEVYYNVEEASFMIDFHNDLIDDRYICKVPQCYEVVWNQYSSKFANKPFNRPQSWTTD